MFDIDNKKLLRPPLTPDDDYDYDDDDDDDDHVIKRISPNKEYAVLISHLDEVTMMNYVGIFNLVDKNNEVIHTFEPFMTWDQTFSWSQDSNYFAMDVSHEKNHYTLMVDLPNRKWTLINSKMAMCDFAFDELNETVTISLNIFGVDPSKYDYPQEKIEKPDDLVMVLKTLNWLSFDDMLDTTTYKALADKNPTNDLLMIESGYHEYHGPFPMSTDCDINGHPLEVFHLMAFADYGDYQSKIWLEEVQSVAKHLSICKKVASYIGVKQRTFPVGYKPVEAADK